MITLSDNDHPVIKAGHEVNPEVLNVTWISTGRAHTRTDSLDE